MSRDAFGTLSRLRAIALFTRGITLHASIFRDEILIFWTRFTFIVRHEVQFVFTFCAF